MDDGTEAALFDTIGPAAHLVAVPEWVEAEMRLGTVPEEL